MGLDEAANLMQTALQLDGHESSSGIERADGQLDEASPGARPPARRPAALDQKISISRSNFSYFLFLPFLEEISIFITGFQAGDFFLSRVPQGATTAAYKGATTGHHHHRGTCNRQ